MIDDADFSKSTIRLLVFQALKHWGTTPLLSLLFDEDCIVRSAAAHELQIRGDEEIFHNVKKHLADPRPYVREICAFTLGQLGTPARPYRDESVPLLLNMLEDTDADVRASSVCALGHLFTHDMPEHVELKLISMVDDDAEDVRECLGFALARSSGSERVIAALNVLKADSNEDVQSWAEFGLEELEDNKQEA